MDDYLLNSSLLRVQTFHATALDACFLTFDVHWLILSLANTSGARLSVCDCHILDTFDLTYFGIIDFILLSKERVSFLMLHAVSGTIWCLWRSFYQNLVKLLDSTYRFLWLITSFLYITVVWNLWKHLLSFSHFLVANFLMYYTIIGGQPLNTSVSCDSCDIQSLFGFCLILRTVHFDCFFLADIHLSLHSWWTMLWSESTLLSTHVWISLLVT